MRLLRLVLLPILLIGSLISSLLAVWVVNAKNSCGRDPQAFYSYLEDYTNLAVEPADREGLLALGDSSCSWLADQPYPWFSRADRFQHSSLHARFWRENPPPAVWDSRDFGDDPQQSVVPAAWSRLCADTWEFHEPHNPFNRQPAD